MKRKLSARMFLALWLTGLAACGSGGGGGGDTPSTPTAGGNPAVPTGSEITLLFMGNSHTSVNNVPGLVAAMVRAGKPGRPVTAIEAPGWMFLEERIGDAETLALLKGRNWSYVVLQAQKYSSSGQFTYSTAEAEEFVRLSRRQQALPILFPEWPRRGIAETERIYQLHVSIARKEPACVAPIPQAWDIAIARHPGLTLHDSDGNHSAPAGAFLAALVIYATATGLPPQDLPALGGTGVDAATQGLLREAAREAISTVPTRLWCPNDIPAP